MKFLIEQNRTIEFTFSSSKVYKDPFNEINFSAIFIYPNGSKRKVSGFWAGNNIWKIRFSSPSIGKYKYYTICSDPSNTGLHNKTGEFEVIPYKGENPLFKHGPLRVSNNKRYLQHLDGKPFFWLGDTWWMGVSSRLKWGKEFTEILNDRVSKGFNVILLVAGLFPDMEPLDERCKNEGGLPWDKSFKSINPEYFYFMDRKINAIVEKGVVPCIVGCWGYYMSFMGIEKIKKHWEYLIARYGSYPVIWCMAGETSMAYYLSKDREKEIIYLKKAWTDVLEYIKKINHFENLITTHPCRFAREEIEKPELLDFELLQTGHHGILSFPNTINSIKISLKRKPEMPVIIGEVNYEGNLGMSRDDIQRLFFWSCILSGISGYTYGANGIWQFNLKNKPFGPSPYGRSWGDTPWKEAYKLPGSKQIGLGKRLLEKYKWWEFQPQPERIEIGERNLFFKENEFFVPYASGISDKILFVYFSPLFSKLVKVKKFKKTEKYISFFFDPETGKKYPEMEIIPDSNGDWKIPQIPVYKDLILIIEKKS